MFSGRGFFQHLTTDGKIKFIRNAVIKENRRILDLQHPNQRFYNNSFSCQVVNQKYWESKNYFHIWAMAEADKIKTNFEYFLTHVAASCHPEYHL